jgi:hypothetical protein
MKNADAHQARPAVSWLLPHRWLIAAVVAVQGLAAAYLGWCKLLANSELAGGGKYAAPFQQVMYTIDWAGAVLGFLFLVVAFLLPPQRWVDDLVAWLGRNVRRVAAGVAVVLAVLSIIAHHAYPFTMDEYAPYFQSQVFARGRLAGQWPPDVATLLVAPVNVNWFIGMSKVTGQTCSEYWPGQAILMTPFTFLGIPWASNPVLSACAILLMAAAVRRAFGEQAVGWAVLFMIGSPVFAAYGISFYAMTSHLTLNLLYALLLISPTLPRVAGAGLVGGFALVLHNPFPHFIFALPWLGWLGLRSDRWTRLPLIGLCYAAVFLPIDVGWRHVEESIHGDRPASLFASSVAEAPTSAEQSVPAADKGVDTDATAKVASPGPPRSTAAPSGISAIVGPLLGYLSTIQLPSFGDFWQGRLLAFLRLVAWDAPGLVVLACWGWWRNRQSTAARLFAFSGLTTFLGYSLIAMSGGHGWGYRYFFSAWSCLPFLASGLAANRSGNDVADGVERSGHGAVPVELLRAVGFAAVLSFAVCLPVRLWQIHGLIAEHVSQMPPRPADRKLVQGDIVSFLDPRQGYFRTDLIRNHPFFESGPYVFVSQGPEQDKVVIQTLAETIGLQARMIHADRRGSTWILQPSPQPEPGP